MKASSRLFFKHSPFIYHFLLAESHRIEVLVPQPGIKPMPPAVEVQSLNHWTSREVPLLWFHFTLS